MEQVKTSSQQITPFLWFDGNAEEAANFYTSVFKNSSITQIERYPENAPGKAGSVMIVSFSLNGQNFTAMNAEPAFKFNEAISFVVNCEDQNEIDYFWEKLSGDGGKEVECGWLKDKFGLSWQIIPKQLGELMKGGPQVVQALWKMKKIDLKTLQEAYDKK